MNNIDKLDIHQYILQLHSIQSTIKQYFTYNRPTDVTFDTLPEYVLLKVPVRASKLEDQFTGPHKVISGRYPNLVIMVNGQPRTVNVSQTKVAERMSNSANMPGPSAVVAHEEEPNNEVDPTSARMQPRVYLEKLTSTHCTDHV